jgi:ATP-dependent helicase/nuclease subunit A
VTQGAFDFFASAPARPQTTTERRNLVIEAGAGTGKTTAIVAEVLALMLDREDLAPERIVLMTFTEKAAGEIADRIRDALELLASTGAQEWPIGSPTPLVRIADPDRAGRAITRHLANIDALRSQTIHSFCQSLLRSFPIEARLDPQFKIVEGFERSLLYGQLYDAWLDQETRVAPDPDVVAEWELLFEHAGYLFQIRDLVLGLLERRDLLEEGDLDVGAYDEVRPQLEDAVHAIRASSDMSGDEDAQRIFAYVRSTTPATATLEEAVAWLRPIAGHIRDANLPRKGMLKDALNNLRAGKKGRSIYDRLVSHRASLALLSLTRRFVAFLDAEKRKLGVVDFDDLLLRTLALLDDPAVLTAARAQFDTIFVDEFQDTDRTQARIVDKLARDASGAYVPGKVIVVGDPKQSIYGFRRADPETYYRMTEDLVRGGAERRTLGDQFRSDPPLLDAVNAMFTRLFPDVVHDPNVFTPSYRALVARAPVRRELASRVTLLQARHDEKADRWFAEAEAVAAWILANRDGSERDLQRFAILVRRTTKLDDYLDTLERYGIAYVLPPSTMFLERRAPVDLLAVLRAVAWPFDRGAQISAARTPYFALTDVEIADETSPAWIGFQSTIERYREAARHLPVSGLIDLLVSTSGIETVYDALVDGRRHRRHLEHVRAIAFEYDQREGGSVRQFVDEITHRRDEPEEMEPSLADESQNAVRVMSVHAAKGLEFDTVILPDLSFNASSSEGLQLYSVAEPESLVMTGRAETISAHFRFTPDGEKLKTISGARDEAELKRLFYVAVTRARTDVVFVCNTGEETRNAGFLKCLYTAVGIDKTTTWPEEGVEVRDTAIGSVTFQTIAALSARSEQVERARLREGALEQSLRSGELVPTSFEPPAAAAEILTAGEIAARRGGAKHRLAGILLHRVLELWDGAGDVEVVLRAAAADTGADGDAVARVRRRLAELAKSPAFRRITNAELVGREVPVRFVEQGVIVERRIDRLVRENGAEVVIDYKSGPAEPERVRRDGEQVRRYCEAVAAITGRACSGLLWYVDDDNVVPVAASSL